MDNQTDIKNQLAETIKELVSFMDLECQVDIKEETDEKGSRSLVASLYTPENARFLIGKNGQNIKAVEHIIKLLYFKKTKLLNTSPSPKPFSFMVDINDYRKLRVQQVVEKALEVANTVKVSKKAEALDPMSSYERRLIHVELASHPDLETESIGEEPERRVVIRPLII